GSIAVVLVLRMPASAPSGDRVVIQTVVVRSPCSHRGPVPARYPGAAIQRGREDAMRPRRRGPRETGEDRNGKDIPARVSSFRTPAPQPAPLASRLPAGRVALSTEGSLAATARSHVRQMRTLEREAKVQDRFELLAGSA